MSYSPAAQRNQVPILEVLKKYLDTPQTRVLEVGSGTGQHAQFFTQHLSLGEWWLSDQETSFSHLKKCVDDQGTGLKMKGPLKFEVGSHSWPTPLEISALYSANTFHIMSWDHVVTLIEIAGRELKSEALFVVYGPFNYGGKFTSPSNANFDSMLRERDPAMGIRDFEDICKTMETARFVLDFDYSMPANNRTLVFKKI